MNDSNTNLCIGWQKYEDVMEKQLSCPILKNIMQNFMIQNLDFNDADADDEEEEIEEVSYSQSIPTMIPISEELIKEITILSNFECWMGHTNFDITPFIKEQLNSIPGIEVLKICSRYRFFVGIGTMFNFTDVRKDIESNIIPKGE